MYRICKRFDFEASHQLSGLPVGHQCSRLHGHSYRVWLTLESEALDATGFVVDFGDLGDFKRWVDQTLDHRHLNDVMPANPTCENLARFIFDTWQEAIPQLTAVRVSETEKTWGEYRP